MIDSDLVRSELLEKGFYYGSAADFQDFLNLGKKLGSIIRQEDIFLHHTKRRVHLPEEILPHTDQPYIDIIAWHCQDTGTPLIPNLLTDLKGLISTFDEDKFSQLSEIMISYPDPEGIEPPRLTPMLSKRLEKNQVFYIPWYISDQLTTEQKIIWKQIVKEVDNYIADNQFEIKLERDEFLIIDNKRFVHGRREMEPLHTRHLVRLWIESQTPMGI